MTPKERLGLASEQLDRVLGFFDRVETKASALFAINSAFLALLGLNFRPGDLAQWYVSAPLAAAVLLISASIYFTYRASFPTLDGGNNSLIYFREIANRTEANYIDEFTKADEDKLGRDLLGQVWRNSEILKIKYGSVKWAAILLALSLIPWCWFLAAVTVLHGQAPVLS